MSRILVRRATLSLLALCALACSDPIGKRWDWNRMRRQPRYAPYDSSGFFTDGMAMRAPPVGTIPREAALASDDSAGLALAGLRRPADLERGAERFHVFCAVCHGPAGNGGSVVGDNMSDAPPPSLMSARVRALSPTQLHAVITGGFGRMPAYGPSLSASDRWAVVSYVLELQRRSPPAGDGTAVRLP